MSDDKDSLARWRRRAMIAGAALALVCRVVPEEYRVLCAQVSSAMSSCTSPTGGL